MSTIATVFRALLDGYHNVQMSSGQLLTSSTTEQTASLPSLTWKISGWDSEIWQPPFMERVIWDVPATLRVQCEAGNSLPLLEALNDLVDWSSSIYGLPVDADGFVVGPGPVRDALASRNQLFSIAQRFAGPWVKRTTVRTGDADSSFAIADLLFHVEFLNDATPAVENVARVFTLGNNLFGGDLLRDPGTAYTLPIADSDNTRGLGGFATPDTSATLAGNLISPPYVKDIPAIEGTNDPVKEIVITPASIGLVVPTQLSAIAYHVGGWGEQVTLTGAWTSSNPAVATVSATGLATRVAAGLATIRCTYGGAIGVCAVGPAGHDYYGTVLFRAPLHFWAMENVTASEPDLGSGSVPMDVSSMASANQGQTSIIASSTRKSMLMPDLSNYGQCTPAVLPSTTQSVRIQYEVKFLGFPADTQSNSVGWSGCGVATNTNGTTSLFANGSLVATGSRVLSVGTKHVITYGFDSVALQWRWYIDGTLEGSFTVTGTVVSGPFYANVSNSNMYVQAISYELVAPTGTVAAADYTQTL